MTFNPSDILAIAPEIATVVVALAVLMVELVITRKEGVLQALTAVGLLAVGAVAMLVEAGHSGAFNAMVAADGVTLFVKVLFVGITFLIVLMSGDYLRDSGVRHGEYYCVLLLATTGMMFLASATNLVTLFLGLETMSVSLYILAGIRSDRARSSEAALKYLLLGAFASGFLLYGMALIFGGTGGMLNLAAIGDALGKYGASNPAPVYLYAGIGLMMIGFLFKVAAVPFHFWSPDVYQGSPTPVTAFMSAGPKAAALVAFIRLFGWALPDLSFAWVPILGVVAAATMIIGNLVALAQRDIKRMLAYSSISHAGYLLLAIIAAGNTGVRTEAAAGLLFYLVAYYLMNIGAFTIAILVSRARENGDYQIDDYQGLAARQPWLSGAMALFMVSLAGIPPTAGFFGKFYVFSAAVDAGLITLVVIGVVMSVVSAFYYLRIVVFMYMRPSTSSVKIRVAPALAVILILCTIGILKFGLMPGDLMDWANRSSVDLANPRATLALDQPQ